MTGEPESINPESLPDPVRGWRAALPPTQWLPAYRPQWLARDGIAGITLAAYGIPVSLAYASLAGLPPQHGIYGYLVGGACYALFGSSRQLAIGPTSAISMLVGVTVAGMAGGDVARAVDIAALTAFVVAGMCVLAWLLRLSHLVSFISESVLVGFKAGAALTIAMTQLPRLFGVSGGGDGFFERAALLWQQLPDANVPVLAFGLVALAVVWLGERYLPGKPIALIVVGASIVLLTWTSLSTMGFAVVGALPQGLPALHIPPLQPDDLAEVVPLAFACVLLAYVESVSAARSLAGTHGDEVDVRQEFLGLGAANAGAALFQAFPVAGGLSQSSVNDQAGAKTPLALVFASATIGLSLAYLTGLLAHLPTVVLAAIVLVAVKSLVDVAEMRRLWRVSRTEFVVSTVAFGAVLLLGILEGVLVGVLVSLLLLLHRTARPYVAFLGRIGDTRSYGDMARHPENSPAPGVLAFRVEAVLLYFNAGHVHDTVLARVRRTSGLRLVVYDVSASPIVDLTGARMLAALERQLASVGIALRFAGARAPVRDMLRAVGLEERVGPLGRGVTVAQAIDEFLEPGADGYNWGGGKHRRFSGSQAARESGETTMPDSSTRWEWRIFGTRLTKAESWLAAQQSTGVQESDEVYFLSASAGVAKLRNNLMDIKLLREVDADGLERWEPVMKAEFPLREADVAATFEQLQLTRPSVARAAWRVEDFVSDFAGAAGPLRAVAVHKRRVRYAISGCTMELTDVVADGKPARTLAVESADRDAVLGVVRAMGYDGWLNANYLRGLAAILGAEPERYAVIDVGTNSVKFHIGERAGGSAWRRVVDRAEVTRLGEGLEESGAIAPAAIERTAAALRGMVEEARAQRVLAIAAVGTAGLRIASNRVAVLAALREAAGVEVEVISGEEEARLAYVAVVAQLGLPDAPVVVFDTGGGSSQFTFGHSTTVRERFSVDVGAVRYTDRFGLAKAVAPAVVQAALATIRGDLARLDGHERPHAVVGMGGAVTNLTAVMHGMTTYDPDVVQGSKLDSAELDRQLARYASMDADARRTIPGLQPGRAEVILAGGCIVRSILTKLGAESLQVSDRGLRHGVLMERFGP